ncbi:hypothetical protein [Glutamicibacter sp.]|uniref:hypothetical protein n=1 Tax=Glutamicibacter sp. TaxID=1931995 RepID=UPI0028BD20BF|nr:hypothetical protein [Glutamicibacter sp.]
MGLFSKNQRFSFEEIDRLMAAIPDLQLGEASFCAQTLAVGWRKNTPKPGLALRVGALTGWLDLEETLRFAEGTLSVHETWNGSPALLFIFTPASAPADSAAGEALAGVPAEHAGILHPGEDGRLELVATLDPQQRQQLGRWTRSFPRL